MKKIIYWLAIAIFFIFFEQASAQTFLERNLKIGSQGDDVKKLQQILSSSVSIYPAALVTGFFGKLTEQAVSNLQNAIGLDSVGNVGPLTRGFLNDLIGSGQPLAAAIRSRSLNTSNKLKAPTSLIATAASNTSIKLQWADTNTVETGYYVERSLPSSINFVQIASLAANTTSYTNTGLSESTTYYYRVRAFQVKGGTTSYSAYSNVASGTTGNIDTVAPSVPTGIVATATSCSEVKVSWNASTDTGGSGLQGYNVYRDNALFTTIFVPSTSATDSGLTGGSMYTYTVSAFDNSGNQSSQSLGFLVTLPLCSPPPISTTTSIFLQNQPGWPIRVAYGGWNFIGFSKNSPTVGDINGDGYAEIAIGSLASPNTTSNPNPYGGDFYVWDYKGNSLSGWPKHFGYNLIGSPVFADIDPAYPGKEIIFAVQGALKSDPFTGLFTGMAVNAKIYVYHANGTIVNGWPREIDNLVQSSPAVGDLDGDGKLEVVMGAEASGGDSINYDRGRSSIYVWRNDGTPLSGWPKNAGNAIIATPALADLDHDGKLEIIVGISSSGYNSTRGLLYVWKYDGTLLAGWPQQLYNSNGTKADIRSSAAVGDIDSDGNLEIIVGGFESGTNLYVFKSNGALMNGWPKSYAGAFASPALADLNGDGKSEIILGTYDGKMNVWSYDGNVFSGWPVLSVDPASVGSPVIISSAVVADIDGDGISEIIVGSHSVLSDLNLPVKEVFAFHRDGSTVQGFPIILSAIKYTSDSPGVLDPNGVPGNAPLVDTSPAVSDIDKNGMIELVFGSENGSVYTLQMLGNETNVKWRMFHSDQVHSGVQH